MWLSFLPIRPKYQLGMAMIGIAKANLEARRLDRHEIEMESETGESPEEKN